MTAAEMTAAPKNSIERVGRFLQIFDRLEREHGVREWQCGGIRIWPLVKFLLAREIDDYVKEKGLLHLTHDFGLAKKADYARQVAEDTLRNAFLKKPERPDICLLTYEAFRHFCNNRGWYNVFQDPLHDICHGLGLSLHTFELLNVHPSRRPHLHETESITLPIVFARASARLPFYRREFAADIDRLHTLIDQCGDALGLTDRTAFKRNLTASLRFLFAAAEMFERRLRRLAPRVALMCNYYSISGLAFCLACNRLGIPSADISHGASGLYHYAYGGWNAAPEGGYELLPKDFLSRTSEDAEVLKTLIGEGRSYRPAIVVGDLAANAWRRDRIEAAEPARSRLREARVRAGGIGRREILIAAQDLNSLPPAFYDLIEKNSSEYFFWIRFHPIYVSHLSQFSLPFDQTQCEMVQATSCPLFAVLERVKAVVTESSSVAADAQAWGVPAIICHPFGHALYADYINSGRMLQSLDSTSIAAALGRLGSASGTGHSADDSASVLVQRLEKYLLSRTQ